MKTMAEGVAGPSGVSSNDFPVSCANCYLSYGDLCVAENLFYWLSGHYLFLKCAFLMAQKGFVCF